MEKAVLAKLLETDELILWSGRPAPFKIMDEYYKPVFIRNYSIAIVIVASILAALLIGANETMNIKPLIVMLCIPLAVIPSKIIAYRNYGKKCEYFFTNKNIIIYTSESQKLKFPLSDIDKFESVLQCEGTRSIRVGKAVGIPVKKNRDYALSCLVGNANGETSKGCLLYNLSEKDAGAVLELIDTYRVVA